MIDGIVHQQQHDEMTTLISEKDFGTAHRKLVETILLWGSSVSTDYDKLAEPLSKDISIAIEIRRPWGPPIFSKCIWSSIDGAFKYAEEVTSGRQDGKKEIGGYTYYDRLFKQWPGMLAELNRNLATRRAQCITWQPEIDLGAPYPPCLQRIWLRVVHGRLDMHSHWRSRDALKAWGLNVFALAHLHKMWANQMSIGVGVYREFIDSCHIYGRDIETAKRLIVKRSNWQYSLDDMQEKRERT